MSAILFFQAECGNVDDLLESVQSQGRRFDGIALVGTAERFSQSRSLATIANTLSYAWKIPVIALKEIPKNETQLTKKMKIALWPLRPSYKRKPHITRSRSR